MGHQFLSDSLAAELAVVEETIHKRIALKAPVLAIAGPLVLNPDSFRLRAALVLLSANIGTYLPERVVHAAAAAELIYGATQIHNSLIDTARRRTTEESWHGGVGLMVGDYLFALASAEMSLAPDSRVISYYAGSVMKISAARLAPVSTFRPFETAYEQYIAYAAGASAALYEAACMAGVVCGDGGEQARLTLGRYGYHLGLALHLAADLADVLEQPAPLLQGASSSLSRGLVTLPLLAAMAASPDDSLAELQSQSITHPQSLAQLRTAIVASGALVQTREAIAQQLDEALAQLTTLPEGPIRGALADLAAEIGKAATV